MSKITYTEMKDRFEIAKKVSKLLPDGDGKVFTDLDKQIELIEVDYDETKNQTPMIMMLEPGPELEDGEDFEMSLQLTSYNMFKENGEWVFEKRHNK